MACWHDLDEILGICQSRSNWNGYNKKLTICKGYKDFNCPGYTIDKLRPS